ncbi:MAG TPA: flagellar export chaperone FliS [Candidatus Binatia bacterium]|jgi:flagellar protein FliS|nr:flagellar export chaperone FliS [Candidatus Binatia bacterium]
MYAAEYTRRYTEAQVTSVDRRRLLLLVFEGGATFLAGAREALIGGETRRFAEQLSRAQAIISELLGTLDYAQGGVIAVELARLYDYMLHHLTEANITHSVQHLDDVIRVYATVAGAYREILERPAMDGAGFTTTAA